MDFSVYDLDHCAACNEYLYSGDEYFMAKVTEENGWHRLHFCHPDCYAEFLDMYDHLDVVEKGYMNS